MLSVRRLCLTNWYGSCGWCSKRPMKIIDNLKYYFVAAWLVCFPFTEAVANQVHDVSSYLTVTDIKEKSVRIKRAKRMTFRVTADITLKNTSDQVILAPIRSVVNIVGATCAEKVWTRSFSKVVDHNFSEKKKILPGETLKFKVECKKPVRMRVFYEIVSFGVVEESPTLSRDRTNKNRTDKDNFIVLETKPGIFTGLFHSIALNPSGIIWAWGSNHTSQLGDGTLVKRTSPVQIGKNSRWAFVSPGGEHTMALRSDGSLWAWGSNYYGQLGDGTTVRRSLPVRIEKNSHWKAVASGFSHSVAIKSDGTIWAWGFNKYGQIGDNSLIDRRKPVQISEDNDWVAVAAGNNHTVALKSNGTLWSWGSNVYGQLGNAESITKISPGQIGHDSNWTDIVAGEYHNYGIKSDGTLWAWGLNKLGQLGIGSTENAEIPVQVGADRIWEKVAPGHSHTAAIKSDGTLWVWGSNSYGQIGDGTKDNIRLSPVQIDESNEWVDVATGASHTIALKKEGSLWAWGKNSYGQLGIGDDLYTRRVSPTQVPDFKLSMR